MNIVTVSSEDKTINDLLVQAHDDGIILQTADGQKYLLMSIEKWLSFEVGEGEDFAEEVERTGQNEALMEYLAERRSGEKRKTLAEVKAELGLE